MKRERGDVVPDSREEHSSSKSSAMQKAGNKRALNAAPDSAAAGASKRVRQGPDPMKEFSVLLTREFVQRCCTKYTLLHCKYTPVAGIITLRTVHLSLLRGQPLKDGKEEVMLAFEGTDRGAEELRGLFARAHNINLNNLLGGGVGALWGLPLVVVRMLAPFHLYCTACKRKQCQQPRTAANMRSSLHLTRIELFLLSCARSSQATDADKAFFARRDTDLRRVLMMELEARAEAIIRRMLAAGGGALPETLPALDGSVYVTCSLGAAGDHSFLEAGIMPLLTQLGVPMESLGGHLGTIRRYIGDTSKARPDSSLSSPLS
eukprot:4192-Heterococcus_DN1.PRE.1